MRAMPVWEMEEGTSAGRKEWGVSMGALEVADSRVSVLGVGDMGVLLGTGAGAGVGVAKIERDGEPLWTFPRLLVEQFSPSNGDKGRIVSSCDIVWRGSKGDS